MNYDEKSDDYADLPPIQRRKKILQKIDATQAQINQEMAVRYAFDIISVSFRPRLFDESLRSTTIDCFETFSCLQSRCFLVRKASHE